MTFERAVLTLDDPENVAGRIEKLTVRNDATGCLEWQGKRDKKGYGASLSVMSGGRRRHTAPHRAAWMVVNGDATLWMQIDHLCRNRICVEATHLEQVTVSENCKRSDHSNKKGRSGTRPGKATCERSHPEHGYRKTRPDGYTYWHCRPCTRARWLAWNARKLGA